MLTEATMTATMRAQVAPCRRPKPASVTTMPRIRWIHPHEVTSNSKMYSSADEVERVVDQGDESLEGLHHPAEDHQHRREDGQADRSGAVAALLAG